jgi:F-type H+-transporting ATPase subunit b
LLINPSVQFAETSSSSGLGAFNVNLKAFLFQLATFVIVLLILKRWVFPKLIGTLDARRLAVEKSLEEAKQTKETLAKAEARSEEILAKARAQADQALADAKQASRGVISDAEAAAEKRANLIIDEARAQLDQERLKLHHELRAELADLVADATEKITEEKLDRQHDSSLIERAIRGLGR